jgi:sensor histidine kinase YesM
MRKYAVVLSLPLIFLPLFLFFSLSGCTRTGRNSAPPRAVNGVLDLSGWDFNSGGNVSLDGDWEFYWDELIPPGGFEGKRPLAYCSLPSGWAYYRDLALPRHGRATYRLKVKTDSADGIYSLYIPNVYSEYALYVNGGLQHACGSFNEEKTPYLHPLLCHFNLHGGETELVLQVNNELLPYGGGVGQSIRFGSIYRLQREYNFYGISDVILTSISMFSSVFFMILFYTKKRGRELISLFVLCVSVAVRDMLSNTTLMLRVFQHLPFMFGSRLLMITIPCMVAAMLFYTHELYGSEVSKIPFCIMLAPHGLYILSVFALSSMVYMTLFLYYLLTVLAACVFGLYVSVNALRHHRAEAGYFFSGMLVLVSGVVLDGLVYMDVISFEYMLPGALFFFLLIQLVLLAKRYSEATRHAELLSADLQDSLDRITNAETAFMSAQMKPHFLYNALSTIAECCGTDPSMAEKLILSLSKYLRQTLDYDNLRSTVPLKKELELVSAYATIEKARFSNIEVEFDLPEELPELQIPPLTLQPLVENAIKHGLRGTIEGGRVTLRVNLTEKYAAFTVEDDGSGIPEHILKNLGVYPGGSVSIGLYNINTRLMRLYGRGLSITSEPGVGTSVSFDIPLAQ